MPYKQKFHKGDLVQVASDLGPSMSHFPAGVRAIVLGSYNDQFGGGDKHSKTSFSLYLEGEGESSWYYEHQLTLIEHRKLSLLKEWKKKEREERKLHSNLDWIFAHGEEVLKKGYTASFAALANVSVDDLWGGRGEGIDLYSNCEAIETAAKSYLQTHDKEGWLVARDRLLIRRNRNERD